MPSTAIESTLWEAERAELKTVLDSPIFVRSPALSHLLSYLCEKTFAGETDQIKEYSVALDVFDRRDSFDQDTDSIVRVEANRLRKRLSEYYASAGATDPIRITIPLGQYVPSFQKVEASNATASTVLKTGAPQTQRHLLQAGWYRRRWLILAAATILLAGVVAAFFIREKSKPHQTITPAQQQVSEPIVGLPVGEEVPILAGASRT